MEKLNNYAKKINYSPDINIPSLIYFLFIIIYIIILFG